MGEFPAKVTYSVIPAKAGTQNCLKILDSGSRFGCPERRFPLVFKSFERGSRL